MRMWKKHKVAQRQQRIAVLERWRGLNTHRTYRWSGKKGKKNTSAIALKGYPTAMLKIGKVFIKHAGKRQTGHWNNSTI